MDQKNLRDIARLVKESRVQQKYTQQELADKTGISLRSVQRIENAEVFPRSYTLKLLTEHLSIAIDENVLDEKSVKTGLNVRQKVILSIGIAIFFFLSGIAYIFQSPTFPESGFELLLYVAGFVGVYTGVLLTIWK